MINFEVLRATAESRQADLMRQLAADRLVAEALAGRPTLRARLAQRLRRLARDLEPAEYVEPDGCECAPVVLRA